MLAAQRGEETIRTEEAEVGAQDIDILLVEDELDMIECLTLVLPQAFPDAQIRYASTLKKARPLIRRSSLVLLDGNLPDGTSDSLIREFAPDELPFIIVISGDDGLQKILKGLGCQAALKKPFKIEDLLSLLQRRLHLH
jgi:DNA-binding response OmpR family regulator